MIMWSRQIRFLVWAGFAVALCVGASDYVWGQAPPSSEENRETDDLFRLDKAPQTPPEYWRAARLMFRLGRFDQARKFLEQFLNSNPSEDFLISIVESREYAVLNEMRGASELHDLALQVLRRAEEAARKRATDPERIRRMIDYVTKSPVHREYALSQLRKAGADAVPLLLAHLQPLPDGDERAAFVGVLSRLDTTTVRPLIAATESGDQRLIRDIVIVLGRMGDQRALRFLSYFVEARDVPTGTALAARQALQRRLGRSYGATRAVDELVGLARDFYLGRVPIEQEPDGKVRIWRWVPGEGLQAREVTPEYARLFLANRFARLALRLEAGNRQAAAIIVATVLETAPPVETPDGDLNWSDPQAAGAIRIALDGGAAVLAATINFALDEGRNELARRAVRVAREMFTVDQMGVASPLGRAIFRAVRSPEPRVRFTALEAIVSGRPVRAFAGASDVPGLLASYAAPGRGALELLLLAADPAAAPRLASLLGQAGVNVQLRYSFAEALDYVRSHPGVVGLVVSLPVPGVEPSLLLATLRNDPRTAGVPVVVLVEPQQLENWRYLESGYGKVRVDVKPAGDEQAASIVRWLTAEGTPLTEEEQANFRRRALYWLGEIAKGDIPSLDIGPAIPLLIAALRAEDTGPSAAEALGYVGRAETQQELLRTAFDESLAVNVRLAAARAARASMRRHGVLGRIAQEQLNSTLDRADPQTELGRELYMLANLLLGPDRGPQASLRYAVPALP